MSNKIKVAVIEGGHPFDVPGWHRLFSAFDFVDYYPQPIDNWLADWGKCRNDYDVALFYNMNMDPAEAPLSIQVNDALQEFTQAGRGLFILHHALLAFPENKSWIQAVGLQDRAFEYFVDQDLTVEPVNTSHPVSKGIQPFFLHDETYIVQNADPANGNEIIFTTAYEKSMQTLGWVREMNNARVFCFQPGHDAHVWACPAFQEVVGRAIKWLAKHSV